jgi:hypothetical protein
VSYQDDLKKHLAEYKRVHLGVSEPGIFRYRGRQVLHHHILPSAQAVRNLLHDAEPSASAFLKENPRKRHKDFHHLNSSQAFAFNLFFPYFSAGYWRGQGGIGGAQRVTPAQAAGVDSPPLGDW